MKEIPSPLPHAVPGKQALSDGISIAATAHCKRSFSNNSLCKDHYAGLKGAPSGFYQCPYGYTTRRFEFDNQPYFITGVVAFPRYDNELERKVAKENPAIRTSRGEIDAFIKCLQEVERLKAEVVEDAAKVLPHAFHELRKLNGAMLQNAEKEIENRGESRNLLSIKAAAELMRNNFDILEALSNIEGIKNLPLDGTINLYDLAFKMKRVYQEVAAKKSMSIHVNGERLIIIGSQKSFPMVPAILLENAIKYGRPNSHIYVDLAATGGSAILSVTNYSDERIDPSRCFEKGVRFSSGVEGGGFGLFLAREVVQFHQGAISCTIADDAVTMKVTFPLKTTVPHRL